MGDGCRYFVHMPAGSQCLRLFVYLCTLYEAVLCIICVYVCTCMSAIENSFFFSFFYFFLYDLWCSTHVIFHIRRLTACVLQLLCWNYSDLCTLGMYVTYKTHSYRRVA